MRPIDTIKHGLKRAPGLRKLVARAGATRLRRELRSLRRKYEKAAEKLGVVYSESDAIKETRARLLARGIHPETLRRTELGIFWAGTNEEQDRSGFLQSLEDFGRVRCLYDEQGQYGFRSYSTRSPSSLLDSDLREANSRVLISRLAEEMTLRPIHLLMGQMWGNFISVEALRLIQSWGVITVNVSMDDRLPDHWKTVNGVELGSVGLRRGLDLVATTTRESCLWYTVRGCPAIFWPLASDPRHFHGDPEQLRDIDVVFVGSRYGIRDQIVAALLKAGVAVEAFGPGWPRGSVSASESAGLFARSKIVLGVGTVGHTSDIYTLKLRDFDAPMSGALYLTQRNPDLLELFREGREIVCYSNADEAAAQAREFLSNPAARLEIARAGSRRARGEHSWASRLNQLFDSLGFAGRTEQEPSGLDEERASL
jgi:spore maturation protein CgeB